MERCICAEMGATGWNQRHTLCRAHDATPVGDISCGFCHPLHEQRLNQNRPTDDCPCNCHDPEPIEDPEPWISRPDIY